MTTIETPILKAPKEVNAGSNYKTFKDKPSLKLEDTGAVSFELRNNNEGSSGTIQKKCLSETDPTTEVSTGNSTGDGYQTDDSSDDDRNNDPRKMFIGGLSFLTTPEKLREYFSQFGEIAECMVMRDPQTKRARGFGFITFAETEGVDKVLELANHELDNKRIDPKVAFPKKIPQKLIVRTKKVFLGGVSSTSTIEDLRNYFDDFGIVKDAMLMYDKSTQRHRGFGFVTFDDEEVADRVCEIHFHEINAKMVECKKAQPKEIMFPILVNKTKAAMARHPLGMAPEQLLAIHHLGNFLREGHVSINSPQNVPFSFNNYGPRITSSPRPPTTAEAPQSVPFSFNNYGPRITSLPRPPTTAEAHNNMVQSYIPDYNNVHDLHDRRFMTTGFNPMGGDNYHNFFHDMNSETKLKYYRRV